MPVRSEVLAAPTCGTQRCWQHPHARHRGVGSTHTRDSRVSPRRGLAFRIDRTKSHYSNSTRPERQRRDIGSAIKGNHCKAHRLCISFSLPFQNQSFFDLGRVLVESRDLPEQQTAQRQQERPTSPRCEPSSTRSLPLVREPTPMESVMRQTTMHPLTESVMRLRTESRV
jgi:hypothetical protein